MTRRFNVAFNVSALCCCFFLMAQSEDGCTIRIVTDDDDDEEECVDLNEFCPDLQCADFKTDDDGCPICECEEPPGEGEGEGECNVDADCAEGEICAFYEDCGECDPATGQQCLVACEVRGVCEPVRNCDDGTEPICEVASVPECGPGEILAVQNNCWVCVDQQTCQPPDGQQCFSDSDCGPNEFCAVVCEDTGDSDRPSFCEGKCEPLLTGCEAVLCAPGTHCEVSPDGSVQCVPDESECVEDADCGEGAHCEVTCGVDPNCPECDVCVFIGKCVEDPQPPECQSDADCTNGEVCNAGSEVCLPNPGCEDPNGLCDSSCWGFCEPPSCLEDSECPEGQVCVVEQSCAPCTDGDPACLVPCFVEGHCANPDGSDPGGGSDGSVP